MDAVVVVNVVVFANANENENGPSEGPASGTRPHKSHCQTHKKSNGSKQGQHGAHSYSSPQQGAA